MRHNTALAIPAIAILMLSLGFVFEPQNAYAGIPDVHCSEGETSFKAPPVVTSVVPTTDGAVIEWEQAELDADFSILIFEFHLLCAFPHHFEVELQTPEFVLLDDTIDGGDSGTYTITDLECNTEYTFDVDGLWFTPLFGGFHVDGDDETFTTLGCASAGGHVSNFVNWQQPSIGVREDGKRVVKGGLTVNGQTVDADFYFTPFPLIQSDIGEPIDFVFKIWDDRKDNIDTLQVQLGKGKVGESFSMDHTAQYKRDKMTNEVTVTHDPMFTNVIMEQLADQPCVVGGVDCTVIHVSLTPTEAIVGDVVFGVNIWDEARNANTSFFNEGLQVGTEADIIEEIPIDTTVIKKQLRTDDGYGNIDKRYSEAFAMKKAWHTEQVQNKAIELGYIY